MASMPRPTRGHRSTSPATPDQSFGQACHGRYGTGRLPFVGETFAEAAL